MTEKIIVTKEGLEDLKSELDNLIHVIKPEVIEDLRAARAQGDLSENADYDAAKDKQAQVEARIRDIEEMLKNIELIEKDDKAKNIVTLGATVTIKELDTGVQSTYTIVGSVESDPIKGKLSNVTPLAEAIMDLKVGKTALVQVAKPYKVKIISIK